MKKYVKVSDILRVCDNEGLFVDGPVSIEEILDKVPRVSIVKRRSINEYVKEMENDAIVAFAEVVKDIVAYAKIANRKKAFINAQIDELVDNILDDGVRSEDAE